MPEGGAEAKSRLGREMIKAAKYLIEEEFFGDIRKVAKALNKEYVATDLLLRRIIEKNFLAMGFSPYKMNLDRYTIIAKLKEMPKDEAEFQRFVVTLPYNPWLRYAGIQALPRKTLIVTYTVPAETRGDVLSEAVKAHPAIDKNAGVDIYKLQYTFYTKPERFESYFRKGVIRTMVEAKHLVAQALEEKKRVELREFMGRREDPIDPEDVVIMSYLEYKYVITPIWMYRIRGATRLGVKTVRYHFKRHIKNRYYLGVYLKRPPNPEVLDTMFIVVASGKGVEDLSYRLSRTPYAGATCNYDDHVCYIQFFCSEKDLSFIDRILSSYNISVDRAILTFKRNLPPRFHERRTLHASTYSINAKRWYTLDEAEKMAALSAGRYVKKYLKPERLPEGALYIPEKPEKTE